MSQLFISYASADRDKVRVFAEALQGEGWSVWWDRDIDLGRPFQEVIEEELFAADCVLLLWSPTSIESRYVRAEANEGLRMGKLVPVLLGTDRPPFGFRDLQSLDLGDWQGDTTDTRFQYLCQKIALKAQPVATDIQETEGLQAEDRQTVVQDVDGDRAGGTDQPSVTEPVLRQENARMASENPDVAAVPRRTTGRNTIIVVGCSLTLVLLIAVGQWFMAGPPRSDGVADDNGLIAISGGCYIMGSPENESGRDEDERQRKVCLKDFLIGQYEVTFTQYDAFAKVTERDLPDDSGWGRGERPVINVSWGDAVAYADWWGRKIGELCGLPSEAEWEAAARAGTTTAWHWGSSDVLAQNYAWYGQQGAEGTHRVGQKTANEFGLYDTAGNAWEWVQDCYGDYVPEASDGEAVTGDCTSAAGARVLRGGSWLFSPLFLRSAVRGLNDPDYRGVNVGFRVVCRPHRL